MSRVLGRNDDKQESINERRAQLAGGGIQYHSELIPEYREAHQEIKVLFAAIGDTARNGSLADIPAALSMFKRALESHLLSENVRFYCYLEQQFRDDADNLQLAKDFHSEMNGIARQMVKFIRKWTASGVTLQTASDFLVEYQQVGEVLAQRVVAEERDLYPLYQPPA